MRLNVGSGGTSYPGYLNADIARSPHVDVRCDVARLPFKDRAFDTVFARDLLHHVPDPDEAIREMWRVTGRSLEVWESNRRNPYMWWYMVITDFAHDHFTGRRFQRLFAGYPASFAGTNSFDHFVLFDPLGPGRVSDFVMRLFRMASAIVPSYNVAHVESPRV